MNQEHEAAGPGIVVLSSSLDVLHMNRPARALLSQLQRTAQSIGAEQGLTAPLHEHCREIIEAMQEQLASHNWQPVHRYRTIGNPTREILLKGFGLPDSNGVAHSRIVLLLTPHTSAARPGLN